VISPGDGLYLPLVLRVIPLVLGVLSHGIGWNLPLGLGDWDWGNVPFVLGKSALVLVVVSPGSGYNLPGIWSNLPLVLE